MLPIMKKVIAFTIALVLYGSVYAQSADPLPAENAEVPELPRAVLKLSPFHFFNDTFFFGTEIFNNSRNFSLNVDIGVRASKLDGDVKGGIAEIGFRRYVRPFEVRHFRGNTYHQGIYYNIFLQAGRLTQTDKADSPSGVFMEYTLTATSITPGFYFGYQKTMLGVAFLDIYIGGGFKTIDNHFTPFVPEKIDDASPFDPAYSGILPKIGIKLGIRL
jgi:hypothetical protein